MSTANIPSASHSVLRSLNRVNGELDGLLTGLSAYSDADRALRQMAHELAAATARAPDVAIAAVLLNQIAGRYAVRHCIDTAVVACLVARATDRSELDVLTVAAAALTMNVGMMRQIESFQSQASALTADERAMVQRHPAESAELLRRAGVSDEDWLTAVLQHHESDDGSGYPEGRRNGDIAVNARLIGMADRYCACVSARNYRRSMLPPLALGKLRADGGFDAALIDRFCVTLGAYPPGTLVRLANGETGVVASAGARIVHALRDGVGAPISSPRRTDEPGNAIATALHEDDARLRFRMQTVWGELAAL
ncbi:MAG TPA: HD domain-containing phosphohydrolase [Telluria sp.]|nr:HD domain-containing phosphohydrolase [Telluria sp.]